MSNWCLEVEEEVERRRLAGRARTLADPCCPATCTAPARQMIQRETLEDPSKAANTAAPATETQETGDPAMEVRRARVQFLERICLERNQTLV